MTNEFIIIKTTFGNKSSAQKLAKILVEKRFAACVQISEIESFYLWQNKLNQDPEFSLNIKTKKDNFNKISEIITKNHDYENPQIIATKISNLSEDYKSFLNNNIS